MLFFRAQIQTYRSSHSIDTSRLLDYGRDFNGGLPIAIVLGLGLCFCFGPLLIGMLFGCCRCCGNCGAQPYQRAYGSEHYERNVSIYFFLALACATFIVTGGAVLLVGAGQSASIVTEVETTSADLIADVDSLYTYGINVAEYVIFDNVDSLVN